MIPARSVFWGVFDSRYPAGSFNPNEYGDPNATGTGGRFNPLAMPNGQRVATKYLADHPNGAFAETLFRDTSGSRDTSRHDIETRRIAQLSLDASLLLIDLSEEPPSSGFRRLLRAGKAAYPPLRDFATTVYATHPEIAGLLYEGKQLGSPGMNCMVLFEDRVLSSGSTLTIIGEHELTAGTGLRMLRAAARSRQFTLPEGYALGNFVDNAL